MATLEHEQPFARRGDPHVFVSATGLRARLLGAIGIIAGVAALAWLAALGFALLGVGSLHGLVPGAKAIRHDPPAARTQNSSPAATRQQLTPAVVWGPRSRATTSGTRHAPASSHAGAAPTAPPASTHGWAKQGWTAPPGQAKRSQTTTPRNGNGHDVAPGQNTTPPGQSGSHSPHKS